MLRSQGDYGMDLPSHTPHASAPDDARISDDMEGERRFLIHGVTWAAYCAMRELLGSPAVRMTFSNGTLELMSPSPSHESIKTLIARLLELWAVTRGVRLYGYGGTTFRLEARERGLEADECYTVGRSLVDYPDLAIEVVVSSPLLDKLSVYAGLGVPEVWIWQGGRLAIHCLREDGYERVARSERLPDLDVAELERFAALDDQHDAVTSYREALRR